ncbi:MAG TPA: hypothetical protein VNU84_06270 [Candidatus Acidoferrum sp.]|jgi:hypothetical protein|nr:hypothetical protein [Candidatus Acidoferrum sp.]
MNEPKRVLYRGMPMIEGWPEKIQAAQRMTSLTRPGRETPPDQLRSFLDETSTIATNFFRSW